MTAAMVGTFMAFGLMAAIIYVPLYTQAVLGLSATMHGAVTAPAAAIPAVSGIIGGWLMSKTKRYKWLLILGPASSVVALLIVSQLQPGINLFFACGNSVSSMDIWGVYAGCKSYSST